MLSHALLESVMHPVGLEPTTCSLEDRSSNPAELREHFI